MFFVDAAHFVFGTFLCCLWSFARIFVRAASGRQRFNVLGAWNAVTRQLIAVTNTTVVNTETMCELLRKIAASGLTGPITLVLDNARYQRNAVVQALAKELGITLLFLPSYSPNLNLIERLWKFIKRRALYGRYHPTFAEFQAAIQEILDGLSTTHAEATGDADDAQLPAIRGCFTHGRVKYKWGCTIDAATQESGVDERGSGGIQFRHEGDRCRWRRWSGRPPGVVGKSVDDGRCPSHRHCRSRPPRCR